MRIALFGKRADDTVIPFIQGLIKKLEEHQTDIRIFRPFLLDLTDRIAFREQPLFFETQSELQENADVLISIGGDGTILDAASLVGRSGLPVAGINLGRLGFLSAISKEQIDPAVEAIIHGGYVLEPRTMLQLTTGGGHFGNHNVALNDLTVYKPNVMSMLMIKTWINGDFLNSYYADGLIVATPTGSTAYSLSCTGPIITPDSENFLITPIASHNLTVRPIVVRDDVEIRIRVEGKAKEFLVSLDSRIAQLDNNEELVVRKADFKINLLRLPDKSFSQTIREKLNWGLDNRN